MLRQRHVVRLETRPPNIEGKGAVTQRELVDQRPAHAARPHHRRRGPRRRSARHAAGHEHRPRRQLDDHPRQQPARRALPPRHDGRDGQPATSRSAPSAQQIASAIDLIVQMSRLSDGTRKVTAISEITGMEGDVITMQDIFVFERTGVSAERQGDRAASAPPASVRSARIGWPRPAVRCRAACSSTCSRWRRLRDAHWPDRRSSSPSSSAWCSASSGCSCSARSSSRRQALRRRLKGEPRHDDEAPRRRARSNGRSAIAAGSKGSLATAGGGVLRYLAVQIERADMDMPLERLLVMAVAVGFGGASLLAWMLAVVAGHGAARPRRRLAADRLRPLPRRARACASSRSSSPRRSS